MKKFLAIVFSLIFALSACTVAFAGVEDLTCDSCLAKLETVDAYNKHINGGCLVDFKACKFNCGAKIATANVEAHELTCPKGAGKCEYCDADYATQADYAAHKANDCKMINTVGEDAAPIVDKVLDALKNVDWKSLADKVVDLVKGIDIQGLIAKIKPVIEKVVELVKGFAA